MDQPIKEKSCGIIPVSTTDNEFKFLLLKQNIGHWSFPKGHQEGNESDVETALRELREESGIENVVLNDNVQWEITYEHRRHGPPTHKTVVFFLGYVEKDILITMQREEISDFKWCDFNEALSLLYYKTSREMFEEVYAYLDRSKKVTSHM